MAEALLGWARNIIYYMVFLSLAEHLLAGSSYGRYLRLFGGLVLVLVVLGPFGSLGDWEKQVCLISLRSDRSHGSLKKKFLEWKKSVWRA